MITILSEHIWFQKFLPAFNGIVLYKKPSVDNSILSILMPRLQAWGGGGSGWLEHMPYPFTQYRVRS